MFNFVSLQKVLPDGIHWWPQTLLCQGWELQGTKYLLLELEISLVFLGGIEMSETPNVIQCDFDLCVFVFCFCCGWQCSHLFTKLAMKPSDRQNSHFAVRFLVETLTCRRITVISFCRNCAQLLVRLVRWDLLCGLFWEKVECCTILLTAHWRLDDAVECVDFGEETHWKALIFARLGSRHTSVRFSPFFIVHFARAEPWQCVPWCALCVALFK